MQKILRNRNGFSSLGKIVFYYIITSDSTSNARKHLKRVYRVNYDSLTRLKCPREEEEVERESEGLGRIL